MLYPCRLLLASDAEIFREMCLLAAQDVPEAFSETYDKLSKATVEDFKSCFKNGWIVGVFAASTLQGIVGLAKHKGHKGMLWGLYVTPSFRGFGFGHKIIEFLFLEARKSSIKHVFLEVSSSNTHAITLYKKLGFAECDVEKGTLNIGEVVMERNI